MRCCIDCASVFCCATCAICCGVKSPAAANAAACCCCSRVGVMPAASTSWAAVGSQAELEESIVVNKYKSYKENSCLIFVNFVKD